MDKQSRYTELISQIEVFANDADHPVSVLSNCAAVMKTIFPEEYYGHENEMYKEPMNLKRWKDVCMRELRECGGRTENKTKCAKG